MWRGAGRLPGLGPPRVLGRRRRRRRSCASSCSGALAASSPLRAQGQSPRSLQTPKRESESPGCRRAAAEEGTGARSLAPGGCSCYCCSGLNLPSRSRRHRRRRRRRRRGLRRRRRAYCHGRVGPARGERGGALGRPRPRIPWPPGRIRNNRGAPWDIESLGLGAPWKEFAAALQLPGGIAAQGAAGGF